MHVQHLLNPPGTKEATTTLHVLTLLRDLLPCLPAAATKTCCETLLRVMTLGHVVRPCLWWGADTGYYQHASPKLVP